MKQYISILFLGLLIGFSSCQSESTQTAQTTTPETKPIAEAKKDITEIRTLPDEIDFIFPSDLELKTMDDQPIKVGSLLEGSDPLVIYFWLSTCGPCKSELKAITAEYEQWQKETGVRMVAVSTDFGPNIPKMKKIAKEKNWNFEVYHDYKRDFTKVMPGKLNGLPQVIVLNDKQEIIYHRRRYVPGDQKSLYESIKKVSKKFQG